MKIALVTETFAPEVNGVAMTLGRLANGLAERGHAVHLIRPRQRGSTPDMHERISETFVPGMAIPGYPELRFGFPARAALMRTWHRDPPDLVHVATEGPLGWSAVNAARSLGIPVTSGFHTNFDAYCGHYGFGWMRGAVRRYLRYLHNRTQATLVPARGLARDLTTDGFRNVVVVARGVDTVLFNPERRSSELRAAWGLGNDGLAVCHVGRLAPEKNIGAVLRAFESVARVRPDSRLIFVGDGPLKGELSRSYPQHIFAGMRHGVDLATHYASADLFLFPSLTETFGNVASEALASGLGLVAYRCAAAADLVCDGENGRTITPGDEDAFVTAAEALARHPASLSQLRVRAAASVAHLDWNSVHERFADILDQQVHRRGASRREPVFMLSD